MHKAIFPIQRGSHSHVYFVFIVTKHVYDSQLYQTFEHKLRVEASKFNIRVSQDGGGWI